MVRLVHTMPDWLKRLTGRSSAPATEPLPTSREEQNEWIKARFREWQLAWHDIFDRDERLMENVDYDRPDPIPGDIDEDHRLLFGLTHATPATQRACFALLPGGGKMYERYRTFLERPSTPLPEEAARVGVAALIALIDRIGANGDFPRNRVVVVDRDTDDGLAHLSRTDDLSVLLEGSLLAPDLPKDVPGRAARLFLVEPLYSSAGNFHHLNDWVTAVHADELVDAFETQRFDLWMGGWQALFDDEVIVLARREVRGCARPTG